MAKALSAFSRLLSRAAPGQRVNPAQQIGVSGTAVFGGYVQVLERNARMVGQNRYRITSDIFLNTSIVAAGVRYFLDLIAKPAWTVEAADQSAQAQQAKELVETLLFDGALRWPRIVRKAAEFRFHGFGIQEWTAQKRDDGRTGFVSIEPRPQHTICRWEIDQGAILGVYQSDPMTGKEIFLPRGKTVYLVDDTMTDSPEGLGILRHLAEPAHRLREYLKMESKGFETDLRGIPIARVPLTQLDAAVNAGRITKAQADAIKQVAVDFINGHVRSEKSGLLVDSQPYYSQGDNPTPSATPQNDYSLLTGDAQAFADIGKAIERLNHEMAVILGVENMLLGSSGQGGGSRALSQDKSEHLYLVVNSTNRDIASAMERDLIGALWLLNGLEDALKPKLKVEDVQFKDVGEITAALQQMAQAGAVLAPDDPAINDVRQLLGVSAQPEVSPELMGLARARPASAQLSAAESM